MAYELQRLLGEICDLPWHGLGSSTEQAWDRMDDVIWYLDPDAPDEQSVRQSPRVYAAEVLS
jgi:hypothetical protein